ncbi:hypothetical protein BKA82DRAFT_27149 [Pisolithus tinctorius]|uniref:Uncharacterized protein n=1 Tax=Pisolithus tinctorius Marx 270 TaxID=870435 RepID=A0A0C3J385_PISTI|nr:hypothetical protein BKA82DRAFT_27149 [Pisolithus tinctorius]KIO03543.1 hypothetical protein M404DRAFT_27149 [Pisolithus tinctorius Marx 270]
MEAWPTKAESKKDGDTSRNAASTNDTDSHGTNHAALSLTGTRRAYGDAHDEPGKYREARTVETLRVEQKCMPKIPQKSHKNAVLATTRTQRTNGDANDRLGEYSEAQEGETLRDEHNRVPALSQKSYKGTATCQEVNGDVEASTAKLEIGCTNPETAGVRAHLLNAESWPREASDGRSYEGWHARNVSLDETGSLGEYGGKLGGWLRRQIQSFSQGADGERYSGSSNDSTRASAIC